MARTLQSNIRVMSDQWNRIENVAEDRDILTNWLLDSLQWRFWTGRNSPRTEAETRVTAASLFAAQAIARGLIAAGRENEVEEIRQFISTVVPEPDSEPPPAGPSNKHGTSSLVADPGPHRPGHAGLIERTFRYAWFLTTLKRDEVIGEGRKVEAGPGGGGGPQISGRGAECGGRMTCPANTICGMPPLLGIVLDDPLAGKGVLMRGIDGNACHKTGEDAILRKSVARSQS